jgi:protein-disulfide isomerase
MNRVILFGALAFLLFQTIACTDNAKLQNEIEELRNEIKGLKRFIETRLKQRPSARPQQFAIRKTDIKNDPFMGSADAPLVLVEFSDYECPFCGMFFRDTLPHIKKEYIDTGKLKYVFKDFPLDFHRNARKAAEASHCAGENGKYWEMHDLIFANQRQMGVPNLIRHAENLGLNAEEFKRCLNDGRHAEGIKKDMAAGQSSGITGTPSFILGKQNKNGEVAGNMISGAQPYTAFKTAIDSLLK